MQDNLQVTLEELAALREKMDYLQRNSRPGVQNDGAAMMVTLGLVPVVPPAALIAAGVGAAAGGLFSSGAFITGLLTGAAVGGGIIIGGAIALGGIVLGLSYFGQKQEEKECRKRRQLLPKVKEEYVQKYDAAVEKFGEALSLRHQGQSPEAMKLGALELTENFNLKAAPSTQFESYTLNKTLLMAGFTPISLEAPMELAVVSYRVGQDKYDVVLLGDSDVAVQAFAKAQQSPKVQGKAGEDLVQALHAEAGDAVVIIERYKNGQRNDGVNGEAAAQRFASKQYVRNMLGVYFTHEMHFKDGVLHDGAKGEPAVAAFEENGALAALGRATNGEEVKAASAAEIAAYAAAHTCKPTNSPTLGK